MKYYPYHPHGRKPDWPPVPLAMILPHGDQAEHNHGQTLNRLAERGGLCPEEMLSVLQDRRYRRGITDEQAIAEIRVLVDKWEARDGR